VHALLPFAVYEFFQNGGVSCYVCRLPNSDAVAASLAIASIATESPVDVLTVTALTPGANGNTLYVEVAAAGTPGRFNFNVYAAGNLATPVESYPSVSVNPTDSRSLQSMVTGVSSRVAVAVTLPTSGYEVGDTDPVLTAPTLLTSGADGTTSPIYATAIPAILDELPNQILYVNLPGVSNITTLTAVLNYAEARGDVFVIVDGAQATAPVTGASVTAEYTAMVTGGSSLPAVACAAVYAPWVLVPDPASSVPGASRWLPPGALVAGQFQATDISRGTFKTPAGIGNPVNIIQTEANLSNTQMDTLNNDAVNVIRNVPGAGYCIFGGRTLHPGYPDRSIGVRRKLIQTEHDLNWLTLFATFEPNDSDLWANITTVLNSYLLQQFQAGTLGGDTAAGSYAVVCDETNNSDNAAAAGIVTAAVMINLIGHAEWINITVSQLTASANS
jgi:phage tail sheath protein FI